MNAVLSITPSILTKIVDEINFWSMLEMFISVLLGFVSALFVEFIIKSKLDKEKKKELIRNLKKELNSVKNSLESLKEEQVYIRPYMTPIWISAKSSGSILLLEKEPYYIDIIETYLTIEEGNLIEEKNFDYIVANDKIATNLHDAKKTSRERVEKKIKNALEKLKEAEK